MNTNKLKSLLFFFIDWTWCFPQTLLGWLMVQMLWYHSYKEQLIANEFYAVIFIGKKRKGILYNYLSGFSLGRYICVHAEPERNLLDYERILCHECGHTRQSRRLGWLYLLLVGIPSVYGNLKARKDSRWAETYYDHYPENWADALGGVKR